MVLKLFSLFLFFLTGGKVQVKIITAGYYDKKGEPIKTLSADDSDAFKNMIVSILVSSSIDYFSCTLNKEIRFQTYNSRGIPK